MDLGSFTREAPSNAKHIIDTKMKKERNLAVGVDIGGTHICSVVVDVQTGELVGSPLTTPIDHTCTAEEIFQAWTENLRSTIRSSEEPVRQIGMAFPGPFDYELGISHMDHKFVDIKELNVGTVLQSRLLEYRGLDFKYVNDAGAFALGESQYGAAKDMKKVLVLTLGTGLGSGFISSNKILRDGEGVPPGGEVWDLPFDDGIADEMFSTRWIVKRYNELTGKTVKGAKEVAIMVPVEEAARILFVEFGERLATFTAPLLKSFGCTNVLLGGNISRSLDYFLPAMTRRYGQQDLTVTVKSSVLLDKAAMMGAASLFKK